MGEVAVVMSQEDFDWILMLSNWRGDKIEELKSGCCIESHAPDLSIDDLKKLWKDRATSAFCALENASDGGYPGAIKRIKSIVGRTYTYKGYTISGFGGKIKIGCKTWDRAQLERIKACLVDSDADSISIDDEKWTTTDIDYLLGLKF